MSSFNQYLWSIYLLAALGLILMLWYSLRNARSMIVQDVPVVLAIAVLLTPCSAVPGSASLAPALVALILEGLFDAELSGWRAGVPILLVAVSLLILLFAKYWVVARFFGAPGRGASPVSPVSEPVGAAGATVAAPGLDAVIPGEEAEAEVEPAPDRSGSESSVPIKGPVVDST